MVRQKHWELFFFVVIKLKEPACEKYFQKDLMNASIQFKSKLKECGLAWRKKKKKIIELEGPECSLYTKFKKIPTHSSV